jgi:hypothetical protein
VLANILQINHNKFTDDTYIGPVDFRYEPLGGHSCVNIKYHYSKTEIPSIFVFRTGSILITGAKNIIQINSAYDFITKILDKYYGNIVISSDKIAKIINDLKKFYKKKSNKKKIEKQQLILAN